MPVHIQEMTVNIRVVDSASGNGGQPGETTLPPEIIEQIVRQVLARLKQMERTYKER